MKIVGQNFKSTIARALLKGHPVGGMVAMRRDPFNPYDRYAVAVWLLAEGKLTNVGFINKDAAKVLSESWGDAQWGYGKLLEKNGVELLGYAEGRELEALSIELQTE